jgi:3'5'-cyclic nucleotide phosphodiesterase/Adenylate and Guanylate cyclase catalytic domain
VIGKIILQAGYGPYCLVISYLFFLLSYVAVTGLPEPNKLHALVMARFAKDCMFKLHEVVRGLEVSLGPDTGDLSMRIGMHSGPVTAGVLRADRLRFQLFGDTVNTASRIESTGKRGCIHLSKETADILAKSGKSAWIRERPDRVTAKGKGELITFWLSMSEQSSCGEMEACPQDLTSSGHENGPMKSACYFGLSRSKVEVSAKTMRLVRWNVDVLHGLLRQIAAVRKARAARQPKLVRAKTVELEGKKEKMVLDEVAEVIRLPKLNSKVAHVVAQSQEADVPQEVVAQLHDFVTKLAGMYHSNPFHNFEHASHVTMSVVKLLSRIIAPKDLDFDEAAMKDEKKFMAAMGSKMHDHTYGITSDPLTQFSVVLAALIHDVDHLGVPNAQLVKEETETAKRYKGKSVAEQNSVDLAWQLLMQPDYKDLRTAIGATNDEWTRFRQLVVNSVMATDIVDKELKEARNARWDKAFKGKSTKEDPETEQNRKATIVIEHLIQASDVSHTMQHWHIYRKWNENFFKEMYRAYREGRAEKDPSEFWYNGEIGFFDFYIIPLAKKLKDCGVFGVSSDEYLNYAEQNLAEWKSKGEQVVQEMIRKVKDEYGEGNDSDQDSTTRHADDDIFDI